MPKVRKNLTKRAYALLLYSAGSGSEYQTGYEIIQNMKGSGSKDVYRKLKELAPSKYVEGVILLYWEEFIENKDSDSYKCKIIRKINTIFNLNWQISDDDISTVGLLFEKQGNNEIIVIAYGSSKLLFIVKNELIKEYGYADLTILADGKKNSHHKLIVKRNKKTGKLGLYTVIPYQKVVRYLGIDLSDKAKRSIAEIKSQIQNKYQGHTEIDLESCSEVLEIKNNRDNWLYRLNFRGFLTFLAGESQLNELIKSNKEVRDVITKEWIVKEAPFLDYWQDFEKVGFDVIGTLRNIGAEFINQVIDENINNDYLFVRVTQRYSRVIFSYFDWFEKFIFLEKNKEYVNEYNKHEVNKKFRNYRLKILQLLHIALVKEIEDIRKAEELYKNEDRDIAIIKEVNDLITADSNGVISLDELANKYHLQNPSVLILFTSAMHNNSYNDTHIVIDAYLIPYSIIAPLCLIEDNTRFEDTFPLLYVIPQSLHPKVIRMLGFDILQKKWNDYTDAIIVKRKKPRIKVSYNHVEMNY